MFYFFVFFLNANSKFRSPIFSDLQHGSVKQKPPLNRDPELDRNPAEPPACRHFTQMRESVSVQFSPGDSWEWFARACHLKTGSKGRLVIYDSTV